MTLCVFSPNEAQKISTGDKDFTASLQRDICPDLKQADPAILQKKFQEVVASHPRVVAYLWRGSLAEAVEANRAPAWGSCQQSSTPERCEALAASYQGDLSKKAAEAEEEGSKMSVCDWREEEKIQDQAWLKYFGKNKGLLKDRSRVLQLIQSFPRYQEGFRDNVALSTSDTRLLGTLVMIGHFLGTLGLHAEDNSNMTDLFCSKKYDCNIISTRVIDLLQQTGVKTWEKLEAVYLPYDENLPSHLLLRVALGNGSFVYINNGGEFLPPDIFEHNFSQVIPAWQIFANILSDFGIALLKKGHLEGAIAEFRAALKIHPQLLSAHLSLGVALRMKEDWDGAIAEYREALKIDPRMKEARYQVASALLFKGDLNGAVIECREALKLHPQDATIHNILGRALEKKGDLEGAIAEYREAQKINPHDADFHRNLGAAFHKKGDWEGAIAEFRETLKINPQSANVHNELAMALLRKGDLNEAVTVCREALKLNPQDALNHKILGLALESQGNLEGAIVEYQEVLKITPEDEEAKKVLNDLLKKIESKRSWGGCNVSW